MDYLLIQWVATETLFSESSGGLLPELFVELPHSLNGVCSSISRLLDHQVRTVRFTLSPQVAAFAGRFMAQGKLSIRVQQQRCVVCLLMAEARPTLLAPMLLAYQTFFTGKPAKLNKVCDICCALWMVLYLNWKSPVVLLGNFKFCWFYTDDIFQRISDSPLLNKNKENGNISDTNIRRLANPQLSLPKQMDGVENVRRVVVTTARIRDTDAIVSFENYKPDQARRSVEASSRISVSLPLSNVAHSTLQLITTAHQISTLKSTSHISSPPPKSRCRTSSCASGLKASPVARTRVTASIGPVNALATTGIQTTPQVLNQRIRVPSVQSPSPIRGSPDVKKNRAMTHMVCGWKLYNE